MIKYKTGNLLGVKSGIIVHGVNTLGVMGAGVALAIREKYPECFEEYKEYIAAEVEMAQEAFDADLEIDDCLMEIDRPGSEILLGEVNYFEVNKKLLIANAFTQDRIGFDQDGNPPADLDAITCCLEEIADTAKSYKMSIHMPKIGCGLGGLDWNDVSVIAEHAFKDLDVTCWSL